VADAQDLHQIEYRHHQTKDLSPVASSMSRESVAGWDARIRAWVRHPHSDTLSESVCYQVYPNGSAALAWRYWDRRAAVRADGSHGRPLVSRVLVGSASVLTPEVAVALCRTGPAPELIGPPPGQVPDDAVLEVVSGEEVAGLARQMTRKLDAGALALEGRLQAVLAAVLAEPTMPLGINAPDEVMQQPVSDGAQCLLLWGLRRIAGPVLGAAGREWSFSTFEPPLGDTDPATLPRIVFRELSTGTQRPPARTRREVQVRPFTSSALDPEAPYAARIGLAGWLIAEYREQGGDWLRDFIIDSCGSETTSPKRLERVREALMARQAQMPGSSEPTRAIKVLPRPEAEAPPASHQAAEAFPATADHSRPATDDHMIADEVRESDREAAQREAAERAAAEREAAEREAAGREAAQLGTAQQEIAEREAAGREAAEREAAQLEAAQREAAEREIAEREAAEIAKREAAMLSRADVAVANAGAVDQSSLIASTPGRGAGGDVVQVQDYQAQPRYSPGPGQAAPEWQRSAPQGGGYIARQPGNAPALPDDPRRPLASPRDPQEAPMLPASGRGGHSGRPWNNLFGSAQEDAHSHPTSTSSLTDLLRQLEIVRDDRAQFDNCVREIGRFTVRSVGPNDRLHSWDVISANGWYAGISEIISPVEISHIFQLVVIPVLDEPGEPEKIAWWARGAPNDMIAGLLLAAKNTGPERHHQVMGILEPVLAEQRAIAGGFLSLWDSGWATVRPTGHGHSDSKGGGKSWNPWRR
jgi:hypothetical protein